MRQGKGKNRDRERWRWSWWWWNEQTIVTEKLKRKAIKRPVKSCLTFSFLAQSQQCRRSHLLTFFKALSFHLFYSFVQSTRLHLEQKGEDWCCDRKTLLPSSTKGLRLWNKQSTREESLNMTKKDLLMWWHVPYAGLRNVRYQQQGAKPVTCHVIIKETQGIWLLYRGMLFIFLICPWLQCTLSLVVMIQKSKCRSSSLWAS